MFTSVGNVFCIHWGLVVVFFNKLPTQSSLLSHEPQVIQYGWILTFCLNSPLSSFFFLSDSLPLLLSSLCFIWKIFSHVPQPADNIKETKKQVCSANTTTTKHTRWMVQIDTSMTSCYNQYIQAGNNDKQYISCLVYEVHTFKKVSWVIHWVMHVCIYRLYPQF